MGHGGSQVLADSNRSNCISGHFTQIFALVNSTTANHIQWVLANPLLAALDEALECPQVAHLARADRLALALALWWLIESVADEFEMPPERAADEVVTCLPIVGPIDSREDGPLFLVP
jgi:hypothetical protein